MRCSMRWRGKHAADLRERDLIAQLLAPLATHRAARGLTDDTAVWLPPLGRELVLTHDVLAAGVHYLPDDPPSDIAWKLLAVNLSDLAAKGATPSGVLLGLGLSAAEDDDWLRSFVAGLARGLERWNVALFGGDTVSGLAQAVLGLTAIGHVQPGSARARSGAKAGDLLWVSGSIGDAGLGLAVAQGKLPPDKYLLNRFRRPEPRLALGAALAPIAHAVMDVSDGVLIDAARMAEASGLGVEIHLAALPLSPAATMHTPDDSARLERAIAGDDYELLFAAPAEADFAALAAAQRLPLTCIGSFATGSGLRVTGSNGNDCTPDRLGWEH